MSNKFDIEVRVGGVLVNTEADTWAGWEAFDKRYPRSISQDLPALSEGRG